MMDELEKSIVEKIDRFKNAVQMATSNSPEQREIFFTCPICGGNAVAYLEEETIHAFCTHCGLCLIK